MNGASQQKMTRNSVVGYKKIKIQFERCNIIKRESKILRLRRIRGKKNGRLLTSHRYNHLSLLPSGPGEVQQELVV
jgi:hypothetical protein